MEDKAVLGGAPPSYSEASGGASARPLQTNFTSLSLHFGDKLRMLRFPHIAQSVVREIVSTTWPGGLQREQDYHGAYELKLRGYPWMSQGVDAVTSRQLMNRILAALYELGWVLTLSTDVSKIIGDLDTLLFRYQTAAPTRRDWMAISFSNGDQIRFIWDHLRGTKPAIVDDYIVALGGAVQRHEPHRAPGCYEIKIIGYPWRASHGDTNIHARVLLLQLLTTLEMNGWTVYASVDQKEQSGSNNSARGDTDTWHCCREVGWTPGMPVYHH
ncbi:hypothetical protein ANO11243_034900 [Dothideomycetidae sp. 11243]|nr:hypothetical protein ANO11243_034900 [fungal sp. No.11243]